LTRPDTHSHDRLRGLRVLIVEDEPLVAALIEEHLLDLGCAVVFSARRLSKAQESLEKTEIDAAILDVNVAGESITPFAAGLEERGIPFVFASGYGSNGIEPRWMTREVLQKPFSAEELEKALRACLGS
jgi:DNA-binding response OmpR family regulator